MNMKDQFMPMDAIRRLKEGNERFANGLRSVESLSSSMKIRDLAENGQRPFAIILTCSDSRVPAEAVFDQGLGDLFVIRVAGNIAAPSLVASIEFAAMNFGSAACVVMGHSQCGAVKAALDRHIHGAVLPTKNLNILTESLKQAVVKVANTSNSQSQHTLNRVTWANVENTIANIKESSEVIRNLVADHKLLLTGAVYELATGRVAWAD